MAHFDDDGDRTPIVGQLLDAVKLVHFLRVRLGFPSNDVLANPLNRHLADLVLEKSEKWLAECRGSRCWLVACPETRNSRLRAHLDRLRDFQGESSLNTRQLGGSYFRLSSSVPEL